MFARTRARGAIVATALVLTACTSSSPPAPTPRTPPSTPGASASSSATSPSPTTQPAVTAARISSPRDGSLLVRGGYPRVESSCTHHRQPKLLARYPGTLRVARADDGTLSITVTLPFETYLEGIAEMPPSWPMAALQAQAIAARSYALASTGWTGAQGETLDTPICATSSCQVYGGIPVEPSPDVHRWYRAVRGTAGEVLVYGDRPADTVYFSTSDGHTYGNEDVFGSAPLPYLRPVVERDDGASPTSRWSVRLPFDDLATFLRAAGDWRKDAAISDVRLENGTVVVSGGGRSRSIDLSTFRDAVNTWAPCLMPGRYPAGGLPTTIPSEWLTLSSANAALTVTGRGWGHGVGMVQWGAYGKARLGWSADRILAYYYGGLRPQRYPEPGLIHVEVATGLASLRILPSAPGAKVNGTRVGTGPIMVGGGSRLTLDTP